MVKEKKELKCLRCKYEWKPITDNVKVCPRCKSYQWNMPRVREKKDTVWDKPNKKIEYVKGKDPTSVMKEMRV